MLVQKIPGSPTTAARADGRLLVLVVCAAVAVCAWWFAHDRSLARLRGGEPLRVGYAVEAPYSYLTQTGRVTGEGPETARKVAQRLGLGEPEWVLTDFGALIGQLEAGRFDVIAAGMFITKEREARVAFSHETARVLPGLLVAKGNPRGFRSYRDMVETEGVKVAVLAGSVEAEAITDKHMPAHRMVTVPDVAAGLALLLAGKVDGLALSRPTVKWLAQREDCVGRVEAAAGFAPPKSAAPGRVAFAFRQGDRRLRTAWNGALDEVLAAPEHRRMLRELGFAQAEDDE